MQTARGVYLGLTKIGSNGVFPHVSVAQAPSFDSLAATKQAETMMDALLLIFAWGAGIMSLFLVADMIAADFATRRAERIARRQGEQQPGRRGVSPSR